MTVFVVAGVAALAGRANDARVMSETAKPHLVLPCDLPFMKGLLGTGMVREHRKQVASVNEEEVKLVVNFG
jgi:hypothetical protein